jgi:hypothetical protein
MDAAAAALFGATIGLTGTVVAPLVNAYQAKRAKSQDLMRDAYARGFACLAKIPRCDTLDEHKRLRDKMLDALAHIEIVGTKTTSDLYGTVVDTYEAWKVNGAPNTDFASSARKFQASARSDIDSSDETGISTPVLIARLIIAVLALVIYWWARSPVTFHEANRLLSALELAIAALVSMVAVYLGVGSVIRLVKLLRHS